jgi:hypothetical protein
MTQIYDRVITHFSGPFVHFWRRGLYLGSHVCVQFVLLTYINIYDLLAASTTAQSVRVYMRAQHSSITEANIQRYGDNSAIF